MSKTLTITITNLSEKMYKTLWEAAVQSAPTKILGPVATDHIKFDFPTMDDRLTKPFAEMLALATTIHAINTYQEEKN